METYKKVMVTGSAVTLTLLVALAPAIVFGADVVKHTNKDTGNESTNRNRTRILREPTTRFETRANARNKVDVDADTGDNEMNKNTTAGTLDTGTITVDGVLDNTLNAGDPCGCEPPAPIEADVDLTNDTTGNKSTNTNRVRITDRSKWTVERTARARNTVDVDADTGDNEMNKNTSGGNVTTGDVSVLLDMLNTLN